MSNLSQPFAATLRSFLALMLVGSVLAPALASSSASSRLRDFPEVGCRTSLEDRGRKLVATCRNGRLPSNIILVAPNSRRLAGRTLPKVLKAAQADLDCTRCVSPVELAGHPGTPGQILGFDGSGFSWMDVTAGRGLARSSPDADIVLALDPKFSLPQDCNAGQLPKWQTNDQAWVCAGDADTSQSYSAGTGLSLSGSTFAVVSTYRLPQGCGDGSIARWNGTTGSWNCAADQDTTYTAGTGLDLEGRAFSVLFPVAGGDFGTAAAAARSDHMHDDRYFTETELQGSGTLNESGNPVDWSKLKSVPPGFADGVDDGSVVLAQGEGPLTRCEAADTTLTSYTLPQGTLGNDTLRVHFNTAGQEVGGVDGITIKLKVGSNTPVALTADQQHVQGLLRVLNTGADFWWTDGLIGNTSLHNDVSLVAAPFGTASNASGPVTVAVTCSSSSGDAADQDNVRVMLWTVELLKT